MSNTWQQEVMGSLLQRPRTAVIGAGISGVVAAAHLKRNGIDVTVFERAAEIGGVWVYNEHLPPEPYFPAVKPSEGEFSPGGAEFAPATPCYRDLNNNVPTPLMVTSHCAWPQGLPDIVPHYVIKRYIQTIATTSAINDSIRLDTSVSLVEKAGQKWVVSTKTQKGIEQGESIKQITEKHELFDSVVVASGHYHAPKVPDIPGLAEWKRQFPDRVQHSKRYRCPEPFSGKTILLIGAGTSSTDIIKELHPYAKIMYQSSRNGDYDFPATVLPSNATRVAEVDHFESPQLSNHSQSDPIPFAVFLKSGLILRDIDHVIICTGYHITLPFFPHLHSDNTPPLSASPNVLVTDGTQLHNLHKDIFYIADPSLIFIGVPYFNATFNLFDYQALAAAAVLAGKASLPSEAEMRAEYDERLRKKGTGKGFHSLKNVSLDYIYDLVDWIDREREARGYDDKVVRHSKDYLDKFWEHSEKVSIIGRGAPSTIVQ